MKRQDPCVLASSCASFLPHTLSSRAWKVRCKAVFVYKNIASSPDAISCCKNFNLNRGRLLKVKIFLSYHWQTIRMKTKWSSDLRRVLFSDAGHGLRKSQLLHHSLFSSEYDDSSLSFVSSFLFKILPRTNTNCERSVKFRTFWGCFQAAVTRGFWASVSSHLVSSRPPVTQPLWLQLTHHHWAHLFSVSSCPALRTSVVVLS